MFEASGYIDAIPQHKSYFSGVKKDLKLSSGLNSGGRIRTCDLRVMGCIEPKIVIYTYITIYT
jgi:hypothetical protein